MSGTEQNSEILKTPWFKLIAKKAVDSPSPYYVIQSTDAVSIIAMTKDQQVLLVQQYRPAIDSESLELPGGHLKDDETPEEAARRELLEETGYRAVKFQFLGLLYPNTTRMGHKLWCYFAEDATRIQAPRSDEISKLLFCSQTELIHSIESGKIKQALDIAVIFLGIQKKYLSLINNHSEQASV
jgi:8-oxo-dGTP pyrophosphatase MutT (NUDIX family)